MRLFARCAFSLIQNASQLQREGEREKQSERASPFSHHLTPSLPTGLGTCTDCDLGYYSSAVGSTGGCTYCPKGKYANEPGSATCKDCPAGRYGDMPTETRGPSGSECAGLCAEGHYGDQPGATSRQCAGPCAKGSYSRPGAIACKLCPEGRYGDVSGSGIVGFSTPVCTGQCWGAAEGSTCCPRYVFVFAVVGCVASETR